MFQSLRLRTRLTLLFLAFGLLPASVLTYIALNAANTIDAGMASRFQTTAENIADKIDRNLFERYGDVQAFGLNTAVLDKDAWYKVGESDNSIAKVMNRYITTYGIYYLCLLVDDKGKVIAVNSRDDKGQPIATDGLYAKDLSQTPWFKACASGNFTTKMPFTAPGNDASTGTYIDDVHVDPLVKTAYPSDDALTIGFAAPVRDEEGKTIGYWYNAAKFSLIESIVETAYRDTKETMPGLEITVMDGQGNVIVDYDPSSTGKEKVPHDFENVLFKLNLAKRGVEAAVAAVAGQTGSGWAVHARKKINQASGYTHLKGALGYPGMNWSVLVRVPEVDVIQIAGTAAIRRQTYTVGVITTLVIVVCGLWIGNRFSRPIKLAADKLGAAVGMVTNASGQVSQSSQQLAEGASEQASSLEETSASLEEMASMTERNADNSRQASSMSSAALNAADRGKQAMSRMEEAIGQIKSSSDKTANIVKTIDEIAFQTNLLALNAAVEAARAGEAGKGFAVVAEEVRNLAQRSAEAAKSTSALIRDSQANADNGVRAAQDVSQLLEQIASDVRKLSQLIGEVAGASKEQSQGISQITKAVTQIEQVTQANASTSEEAAAASQELSSQAVELRGLVGELMTIVEGIAKGPENGRPTDSRREPRADAHRNMLGTRQKPPVKERQGSETDSRRGGAHRVASVIGTAPNGARLVNSAARSRPSEVIPLDDDDFGEME